MVQTAKLPVITTEQQFEENFKPKDNQTVANEVHDTAEQKFDENFKPKGAIAFFILMVILGLIIWFGIYFLMLSRI